jgi:phage repressor protein C with HTH and peptisase S24 domain
MYAMPTIQEMLKEIISKSDDNQTKAAKRIGISKAYLSNILKNQRATSAGTDSLISQTYAELTGMIPPNVRPAPKLRGLRRVPVVASMRAGFLDDIAADYEDIAAQIDELIETDCQDENAFALIVEGDSMQPRFFAGDRIIVAPNYEPRNGDPVCARIEKDGRTVFKIYRQSGDTIRLESLNPDYKPEEFHKEAFRWIYPAVDMKAKLRR